MKDNIRLLPASIPVDDIIKKFGRITGERLILMMSYIYTVGFWKYNIKDANIQVSAEHLKCLGGNKLMKKTPHREEEGMSKEEVVISASGKSSHIEKKRIREGEGVVMYIVLLDYAIERGWLQRDSSYRVGEYSKSIRYLNRDNLFQHYQEYQLTSKNAIKALKKLTDANRQTFAKRSPSHQKIYDSVNGLVFHDTEAFDWVMALPDGIKKNNLFICLYHLRSSREIWKTDKNGRVYTWPVVMPQELRKFITWNGKTLWQLDVTHCHPLLHVVLYPDWTETGYEEWKADTILEKKKYQALCEQGLLYDFLNDKLGDTKYDISDPDMKRLFKNEVFQQVFYGHPDSKKVSSGNISKVFAEAFPYLWGELSALKTPNHRELSNIMMNMEAEIFVKGVISNCLQKDGTFPMVTIHDCIMTTEDGIGTVRLAIEEEFKRIQMNPLVKVKTS